MLIYLKNIKVFNSQSVSSSFFRFSKIKGKKFDENVFSGEDTLFINNLLLNKPIFGLIREALYLYRRRADSSSTVQTQKFNINFYFKTIEQVEKYLINKSLSLHNKILPFIQFFVGMISFLGQNQKHFYN